MLTSKVSKYWLLGLHGSILLDVEHGKSINTFSHVDNVLWHVNVKHERK